MPQLTTDAFEARYPDGADYIIVPKIEHTADAQVVSFIQEQSAGGSPIVGICAGALTVSAAGLLEGRNATGHWFDIERLRKENPSMTWIRDRRYVADDGVVTTTGVSASLPVSLALVEAIAGPDSAASLAVELGVSTWDARHDSAALFLDDTSKAVAQRNKASGAMDIYAVPVEDGVDEIALGFTADACSALSARAPSRLPTTAGWSPRAAASPWSRMRFSASTPTPRS